MKKEYDKAAADLSMWAANILKDDPTYTPNDIMTFYNSVGYSYDDTDKKKSTVKKHLHPSFTIDAERSQQETMLQCVLGFRRIETLHGGMRWFDIKRWKAGSEYLNGPVYGARFGNNNSLIKLDNYKFLETRDYLWSVPLSQLDINGHLKPNNSGYSN